MDWFRPDHVYGDPDSPENYDCSYENCQIKLADAEHELLQVMQTQEEEAYALKIAEQRFKDSLDKVRRAQHNVEVVSRGLHEGDPMLTNTVNLLQKSSEEVCEILAHLEELAAHRVRLNNELQDAEADVERYAKLAQAEKRGL